MIFPVAITSSWIATKQYPASVYREALGLYELEEYEACNAMLTNLLDSFVTIGPAGNVSADRVLTLLGWSLLYSKRFENLDALLKKVSRECFNEYLELDAIRIWLLVQTGNTQEALDLCEDFEELVGNTIPATLSHVLFAKGISKYQTGCPADCIENLEIASSLYTLLKMGSGAAAASNYLGFVHSRLSDYRGSLMWLNRALHHYESVSLIQKQSMVHLNIGITHYKIGDYTAAFTHLNQSHKIGVDGNWPHRQCFTNIALGNVHRLTQDYKSARQHLTTAYNQAQELQFPREEALALEFLGDVYRDEGNPREARRFYARAMAIGLRIAPEGDIVMEVHRRIGECHNLEGNQGEALKSLNKALKMANAQGDRFEAAVTLRVMCETVINTGDLKSARKYIDESVSILNEIGAHHKHAISLLTSVNLALQEVEDPRSGTPRIVRLNLAWKQATKALDLFIKVDVPFWTSKGRAAVARVSAMRDAQEKADKEAMATGNVIKPGGYNPGEVIIYQSRLMRDMIQLCDMFATTDEPVLITGETGTGKEVVAKRLHAFSSRAEKPLVIVNVAAIPETMFEREFFGHVKGAFSGATSNGEGYAGRANGGTLFLDEIGDLPLDLQPKLLRLLQERTYQALGDPKQRHTDIRLVAATNADLEQNVRDGRFRADLYYRLRTLDLPLPPVRDRCEDILPLMRHFLCMAAKRPVDLREYFNQATIDALEAYDWPGNVREIAMVARQSHVAFSALGRVELKIKRPGQAELWLTGPGLVAMEAAAGDTPEPVIVTPVVAEPETVTPPLPLTHSETVERARILVALDEAGENRNEAARALGISRSTLYRKMEKYGIPTRRI